MTALPTTVAEAVECVAQWPSLSASNAIDYLLSPDDTDVAALHFWLGAAIRNEFRLWSDNEALRQSTGSDHADDASGVIIRALREHLLANATPQQLDDARRAREQRVEASAQFWKAQAGKDAAITDRRCPACGSPCPRYRQTCKACRHEVGRVQE